MYGVQRASARCTPYEVDEFQDSTLFFIRHLLFPSPFSADRVLKVQTRRFRPFWQWLSASCSLLVLTLLSLTFISNIFRAFSDFRLLRLSPVQPRYLLRHRRCLGIRVHTTLGTTKPSKHSLRHNFSIMRLRRAARVILIGAPGVGKGTQSERLLHRFPQLQSLSTGDLLRHNVKARTPLGKPTQEYVSFSSRDH